MSKKSKKHKSVPNSARAKRVHDGVGADCPKCDHPMLRFRHPDGFVPKKAQPYYFAWWDVCRPCRHIQHYEEAKVYVDPNREQLARMNSEYRAIVGRAK